MQKLHIGFHKTGTTFLQKRIFPKLDNYIGRNYGDKILPGVLDLKKYEKKIFNSDAEIYFYSNELFSKWYHQEIIDYLKKNKKMDILITLRNQSDLLYSRFNHKTTNFYLQNSINTFYKTSKITPDIIEHYNFQKLINLLREDGHKVTYIWFEDIISLNQKAINIMSKYLNNDISELLQKNINNVENKGEKKKSNIKKINVDKYFNNKDLDYSDL